MIKFKEFINEKKISAGDAYDAIFNAIDQGDKKFDEEFWDFLESETGDKAYAGDSTPDELVDKLDDKQLIRAYALFSKKFKNLFESMNEAKIPTVGLVKKSLKSLDFEMIHPEFFEVEKKNTDAGMGGYDYIQINFDADAAKSPKRASDVELGLKALTSKWKNAKVDTKAGTIIISESLNEGKEATLYKELLKNLNKSGTKYSIDDSKIHGQPRIKIGDLVITSGTEFHDHYSIFKDGKEIGSEKTLSKVLKFLD